MRMRFISIAVLVAAFLCVGCGLITKQLPLSYVITAAICLALGAAMAGRIGFAEVPAHRLWIIFWLPQALSAYAVAGFMLDWGRAVSWSVIALAYIAGSRAANLAQILREGL